MAFVGWDRLRGLNADKGEEMGARAVEDVQPTLRAAGTAVSRESIGMGDGSTEGKVSAANEKLKALRSLGGTSAALGGGKTAPMSAFDAALAGQSKAVGNTVNQYAQMFSAQNVQAAREQGQQRNQQMAEMKSAVDVRNRQRALQQMQQAEDSRRQADYDAQKRARIESGQPLSSEYAEYSDYIRRGRRF